MVVLDVALRKDFKILGKIATNVLVEKNKYTFICGL